MKTLHQVICGCVVTLGLMVFAAPSLANDFDGDGLQDLHLYDPSTATFFVRHSSTVAVEKHQLGMTGNIPAPGDFNGNGRTDLATFNRSTGEWQFRVVQPGGVQRFSLIFGHPGELPVPGRYRGNTCTDLATYDPRTGVWTVADCKIPRFNKITFGGPGEIPVPADYDGDGKTDLATFNRQSRRWSIRRSSDNKVVRFNYGLRGDIPLAANFDGRGGDEAIVFRQVGNFPPGTGQFFIRRSNGSTFQRPFGLSRSIPSVLDVVGDGKLDLVVFDPTSSSFNITTSTLFDFTNITLPNSNVALPVVGENPPPSISIPFDPIRAFRGAVPGDFNRDGASDLVFITPVGGVLHWVVHTAGGIYTMRFGVENDIVLSGDTDGDLRHEPIVVRTRGDNFLDWYLRQPAGTAFHFIFGKKGDIPLVGDVDLDGKDDLVVVRRVGQELHWFAYLSTGGMVGPIPFGLAGDIPYLADFNGDGRNEFVVAQKALGGIYWHSRRYNSSTISSRQWGLAATDVPVAPMDINGDGTDDPAIVRLDPAGNRLYVRLLDGSAAIYPIPGDGIAFLGHFGGTTGAKPAYYSPGARTLNVISDGSSTSTDVGGGALMMAPSGDVFSVFPVNNPGDTGPALRCDVVASFVDGAGTGALWKPVSESNGRPVILLPASYWTRIQSIAVFGANGSQVAAGTKRSCCPNGNRAHFDITRHARDLTPHQPLTVQFIMNDGTTECRGVPEPERRYD